MRVHKQNLFIIGLDDLTLQQLRQLPQAAHCTFRPLLGIDAIRDVARCDMRELIHDAVGALASFRGSVDGIASVCGFPATLLVSILAARFRLPSPSLAAVLKCEHRYWGRREQAAAVRAHVPRFQAFAPFDDDVAEQIKLEPPYWVKSFDAPAADLCLPIHRSRDLAAALAAIPRNEAALSRPLRWVLQNFDLSAPITQCNECLLAEVMVGGKLYALEGYVYGGEVRGHVLGATADDSDASSGLHPDASPLAMQLEQRMWNIADAVLARIGLNNAPFRIKFLYDANIDHLWLMEIDPRISRRHDDRFEHRHGISPLGVLVDLALGKAPALMTKNEQPPPAGLEANGHETELEYEFATTAEGAGVTAPTRLNQADVEVAGSRILVVDDEEQHLARLASMLQEAGFEVALARDSRQLFTQLRQAKPDLILLDIRLRREDGFDVCEQLQSDAKTAEIPVIFITSLHKDAGSIARGFAAGGVDFITRPFYPEELTARVQTHLRLKKYREHLEDLTRIDPLTRLLNRRATLEHLESERRRAHRTGLVYALVLADIDDFKPVNDCHGHRCGDAVLAGVATLFKGRIRRSEQACRWGGEEFLLLLPSTDADGAAVVAEDLRALVEATPFTCNGKSIRVTVSFGIMADSGEQPFAACISKADDALYAAKRAGRNRTVIHEDACRSLRE